MRGGLTPGERELIKLASRLTNQMFDYNKKTFYENQNSDFKKRRISSIYPSNIKEEDIDIIGPDYDPVINYSTNLLNSVMDWHTRNPSIAPPWQSFVGKLCKVPNGFFANNKIPRGNLYNVKQSPENFNQNFPRDPTNANIDEISFDILGPANPEGKVVDINNARISSGTYKYAVLSNEIRYVPDTGSVIPYYYLPSVMLYFYNKDWISFD